MGQKPILVGFAGEITGRRSEIGVSERDGAQLAVDMINEKGGVDGRPIKLIIKDDKGDLETARRVDTELANQGVVAIIGHVTSGQTAAVFDQINQTRIVLLSPTATSVQFSNQADYFFRVVPSTAVLGESLAQHITAQDVQQITGIYDLGNRAYTETLWRALQTEFEESGGDAGQSFTFTSGETNLKDFVGTVLKTRPEAVVFVASAVDVALMSQYLRVQGSDPQLFAAPWAQTGELLEKGGEAIEGMTLGAVYHPQNPYPGFQPFVDKFRVRYNRDPEFGAVYAYEAVLVLAHALEKTNGQAAGLPAALTTVKNLPAVQGTISLNQYGDTRREIYIVQVQNGQFNIIETIVPE